MSNIQLAANLLRLRTDHDYTQTQIGAKLNISRQAYSNYETGKRIPARRKQGRRSIRKRTQVPRRLAQGTEDRILRRPARQQKPA